MQERLRGIGKVVDSGAPKCVGLPHLYDRSKKKQLVVARQRVIDFENKKLVDSMAKILHGHGPPLHPYRPYQKGTSKTAVERRMVRERIGLENQFIADRLRNRIDPVIDHNEHAEFYAQATYIRNNISMSHRRDQRIARFKRKKERACSLKNSQVGGVSTFGEGMESLALSEYQPPPVFFDPSTMGTTLTQLRSAGDVREKMAKDRGQVIPAALLSSATKPPPSKIGKSGVTKGQYRLQMDYQANQSGKRGVQPQGISGNILTPMMMGNISLSMLEPPAILVKTEPITSKEACGEGEQ
jgi:hypothetical protein